MEHEQTRGTSSFEGWPTGSCLSISEQNSKQHPQDRESISPSVEFGGIGGKIRSIDRIVNIARDSKGGADTHLKGSQGF